MKDNLPSATQIEAIARVCHEANRIYCQNIGDDAGVPWEVAPEWQRASLIEGVRRVLEHHGTTMIYSAEESHNSWMEHKLKDGWTYGPVKDAAKKQHPALLPYKYLPKEQKRKDSLFLAIVYALNPLADDE